MEMDGEYVTENVCPSKAELEKFVNQYRLLTDEERKNALRIKSKDFYGLVSQMVPCVGCRKSAESLYTHVTSYGIKSFHPMFVGADSSLQLVDGKDNIVALWNLFYSHSKHKLSMLKFFEKSKTGKRCEVHSLEAQRVKAVTSWLDVWEFMDESCQSHCCIIDSKKMTTTLNKYLLKHRFCSECKLKVQTAYKILIGEISSSTESGFVPELYVGIETCPKDRHIHVTTTTSFITSLITRCVPELAGGARKERHAKTMETAQEEVLICLGLCIFERLHIVQQRFGTEERAWEIVMCVGTTIMKKSFDSAVDKKRGISELELLCEEFEKEEKAKNKKKKSKKSKKKNGKTVNIAAGQESCAIVEPKPSQNEKVANTTSKKTAKVEEGKEVVNKNKSPSPTASKETKKNGKKLCSVSPRSSPMPNGDCGYSSGCTVDNPVCSSPEGSEELSTGPIWKVNGKAKTELDKSVEELPYESSDDDNESADKDGTHHERSRDNRRHTRQTELDAEAKILFHHSSKKSNEKKEAERLAKVSHSHKDSSESLEQADATELEVVDGKENKKSKDKIDSCEKVEKPVQNGHGSKSLKGKSRR